MNYWYATGYKTKDAALLALSDMMPEEISESEAPNVKSYIARNGKRRYGIELKQL